MFMSLLCSVRSRFLCKVVKCRVYEVVIERQLSLFPHPRCSLPAGRRNTVSCVISNCIVTSTNMLGISA
jgi:hypothetical protein